MSSLSRIPRPTPDYFRVPVFSEVDSEWLPRTHTTAGAGQRSSRSDDTTRRRRPPTARTPTRPAAGPAGGRPRRLRCPAGCRAAVGRDPSHLRLQDPPVPRLATRRRVDGDPLTDPAARDQAVGDWRAHLVTAANQAPATVNNALAAVDDFYARRGMGRATVERTYVPGKAPRSSTSPPSCAGCARWRPTLPARPGPGQPPVLRWRSDRRNRPPRHTRRRHLGHQGVLRIHGNGGRIREVPIHPKLRTDIRRWLADRPRWPGADTNPALFLNHRGGRLSVRGARDVIARIAVVRRPR